MLRRVPFLLALILAIGLSACNVATPYRGPKVSSSGPAASATGPTVYVGVTHAVLKDDRQYRSLFFDYVKEVEESLSQNSGFLGFSKRVALFGNDAWTMSVWTDEASMDAFVRSEAHQRAIRNAFKALEYARFARLEINAEEAPLSWDRALQVLESNSRVY